MNPARLSQKKIAEIIEEAEYDIGIREERLRSDRLVFPEDIMLNNQIKTRRDIINILSGYRAPLVLRE